jgi:hypothetical protein
VPIYPVRAIRCIGGVSHLVRLFGLLLAPINRSTWKVDSANFALTEFYEVSGSFVLWGTYLFVGQEYAAFVAWHCSLHATHIGVGCSL